MTAEQSLHFEPMRFVSEHPSVKHGTVITPFLFRTIFTETSHSGHLDSLPSGFESPPSNSISALIAARVLTCVPEPSIR